MEMKRIEARNVAPDVHLLHHVRHLWYDNNNNNNFLSSSLNVGNP